MQQVSCKAEIWIFKIKKKAFCIICDFFCMCEMWGEDSYPGTLEESNISPEEILALRNQYQNAYPLPMVLPECHLGQV